MANITSRRLNRWALAALIEASTFKNRTRFAIELETSHSTVFDALSGRRDPSEELMGRMAGALGVPVEAISADPYGVVAPLVGVLQAADRLVPHLNGHDFGLRAAVEAAKEAVAA